MECRRNKEDEKDEIRIERDKTLLTQRKLIGLGLEGERDGRKSSQSGRPTWQTKRETFTRKGFLGRSPRITYTTTVGAGGLWSSVGDGGGEATDGIQPSDDALSSLVN
jgi:hypothetical protein